MIRRCLLMLCVVLPLASSARLSAHDPVAFDGTVVKMDTAKGVLTIQTVDNGQNVTFDITFDSKTTVTQAGKKVSRSALKPGVLVHVEALGCIDEPEIDAVTVRILPAASRASSDTAMGMPMSIDMTMPMTMSSPGASGTEIPRGDRIPTVALHADGFKNGGWSFTITTTLTLTQAMGPYQAMHGHVHVFVDGKETSMIATKHFALKDLVPGTHTVRVELSGTDHRTLLHGGIPIAASQDIIVPPAGR